MKLHILSDVVEYVDVSEVPENITIEIVDVIDHSCVDLEHEIY